MLLYFLSLSLYIWPLISSTKSIFFFLFLRERQKKKEFKIIVMIKQYSRCFLVINNGQLKQKIEKKKGKNTLKMDTVCIILAVYMFAWTINKKYYTEKEKIIHLDNFYFSQVLKNLSMFKHCYFAKKKKLFRIPLKCKINMFIKNKISSEN